MAKKKKVTGKGAAPRRGKRGKPAEDNDTIHFDGEASTQEDSQSSSQPGDQSPSIIPTTSAEPANTQETTTSQPLQCEKLKQIPTVLLHKKFGKYRCLFSETDSGKKYDLGSDSETNSSLEIRVVDPCASSESDSNAALDGGDANKPIAISLDSIPLPPMNRDAPALVEPQCMPIAEVIPIPESIPIPECIGVHLDDIPLPPTRKDILGNQEIQLPSEPPPIISVSEIPLPVYTIPPKDKPDKCQDLLEKQIEKVQEIIEEPNVQQISEMTSEKAGVSMETEQEEQVNEESDDDDNDDDDDDEVITVVQIVEDGESTEYYYDVQSDSPNTDINEGEKETRDFQQHFEGLKLDAKETSVSTPMDCSDTKTADPCPPNNIIENLARPDPSLTPSSTLSDDSNCSRLNSVQNSEGSAESSPTGVRRSSRLKTITNLTKKSKGLVKTPLKKALLTQAKMKLEELGSDSQERPPDVMAPASGSGSPTFPVPIDMPVKVKSRWRRSSELDLMVASSPVHSPLASPGLPSRLNSLADSGDKENEVVPLSKEAYDKIISDRMNQYQHLVENEYLCERMVSRDTKKMICDCFLTKEELDRGERGCGEDCLNRLLMIECNSRCPVGDRCTNRRFQKIQNGPLKVFYADKKGCGVEAAENISTGEFLMEYVGEVLDYDLFYKRAQAYSDENNLHHYFMSLKGDTVIDATLKGNISRFINHSCEPNAETQKWTVNGELRIGFFSKRDIRVGEEITFDYQFQRFGKEAQRCYCGAENCRGWIGAEPDSDDEYYEEEDDVSTSKSLTESSDKSLDASLTGRPDVVRVRKPRRERRKFAVTKPDLVQDADIEEDIEVLSRTGIKNQSHTLRLSRSMVRAKSRPAQVALLRLLRDADLPCRRLFLDYRGLRLLAPWCADAPTHFKLEMLQTVDRLPVPNKTMVVESRFISVVEKWLTAVDAEVSNVFIDEATGLPIELKTVQDPASDKPKDAPANSGKVKELGKQLLERWSSLKEVFKIPKKERIQQMKEHERQANVERRAADSSGSRERSRDDRDRARTRDERRDERRDDYREKHRERDKDRDRDRDRDRERDDRDRRKRRSSPDGRRSIRLTDRVLAAVPPMSKEERRRAFAEAAAAAEETRRQNDAQWAQWEAYAQMFPPGMMPPNMLPPNMMNMPNMPNMPPNMANMPNMPPNMANMPNMPPNMANMPPNMASMPNMPPNMANMGSMPPNMANMPPNMANMPPNMANMPPNMANMPPNMANMPSNMATMPPGMANMPPGMANMPPGMAIPTNVAGMPPNMSNMGGPMMGPMGMMGPEMGQEWMAQPGDFQGQGFPPQFQPQFMMHQPNFMGMNNFGMAGMPPGMPPGMMYPQSQPAFPSQEQPQMQLPHDAPMEQDDGKEVVLPSLWRSATDDRGRTYYYHVKLRQPQWVPPPYSPNGGGDSSSSDEEEMSPLVEPTTMMRRTKGKVVEGLKGIYEVIKEDSHNGLIPEHALVNVKPRKRRPGLVSERPISPRTEEDKLAGRLEVKRYKETKEKLRRRRERLLQKFQLLQNATKKKHRELTPKDLQMADLVDTDSDTSSDSVEVAEPAVVVEPILEATAPMVVVPEEDEEPQVVEEVDADEVARRIKESFRSSMARVMVHHLNPYRHRSAPFGRITNTADFKHLARKLTHFVMLKELKHCRTVEELIVTDSVRSKAKEFVKKYMAKFGPAYKRPAEEAD